MSCHDLDTLTARDFIDVIRLHAEDGVDFVTLHCGITRKTIDQIRKHKRKMNIVSRGGSLVFAWMCMTGEENPFYEYYDEILDICREYDVTISLGDACRPGCLADATDVCQIEELVRLGELTKRAWEKDVQVMVEGPGHVPMDQIAANMKVQQTICMGAPFYVLGPTSTIDLDCPTGADIPIEERDMNEVRTLYGVQTAPATVEVYNPAFDVTPHSLVTGIITEKGVIYPPFKENLQKLFG